MEIARLSHLPLPQNAPQPLHCRPLTHLDTPEKRARARIDAALLTAGWQVQSRDQVNLNAGGGVAIREFRLKPGHGYADYLLYVDGQEIGVIEAKKEGETLTGVEVQAEKYAAGMPDVLPTPYRPLPFLYQSTGIETRFTNRFDPEPRSRRVFQFHQPSTLAEWIQANPLWLPFVKGQPDPRSALPSTLRVRMRAMPSVDEKGLWPAQLTAVRNLETSLAQDRPRALIQMATGSGKTFTAVTATYRFVKFADTKRVLFLVDRANLGRQDCLGKAADRNTQQCVLESQCAVVATGIRDWRSAPVRPTTRSCLRYLQPFDQLFH